MKKFLLIPIAFFALLTIFVITKPVSADVPATMNIKLFFKQDGKEYNKPVDFNIECWGYPSYPPNFEKKEPGAYTPDKVYSFSNTCTSYGCDFSTSIYLNYVNIDTCNLLGKADGRNFEIKDYAKYPFGDGCGVENCSLNFNIPSITTDTKSSTNNGVINDTQQKQDSSISVGDVILNPPLNPIPETEEGDIFSNYAAFFLFALITTIFIETLILLALLKLIWKQKGKDIKIWDIILTGIIVSALTIPYLWYVLPDFLNGVSYITVGEIVVVLVESLIIFWILKLKWRFALLLSFICNLVSYLAGLLIIRLL